jgi:hypothetical protein
VSSRSARPSRSRSSACCSRTRWATTLRRGSHRVRASLPYFIPFPPYYSMIGTIWERSFRLRGPTVSRRVLFDIGAAGPLASLVVSLPTVRDRPRAIRASPPDPRASELPSRFVSRGQPVWLGNGVLTHLLASLFGPAPVGDTLIVLHPLALAGWLGLFVTAPEPAPSGSARRRPRALRAEPAPTYLDRAPLPPHADAARACSGGGGGRGDCVVLVLHRGRVAHPSVLQPELEMTRTSVAWGWFLIATFLLTLTFRSASVVAEKRQAGGARFGQERRNVSCAEPPIRTRNLDICGPLGNISFQLNFFPVGRRLGGVTVSA